jgi:hypothetical protein
MITNLEEQYFVWLYSQIGSVKNRNRARSHWSLARQLHQTEFVWLVPNDDNRVEDGRNLRYRFLAENDGVANELEPADQNWLSLGCSMFEMLIALSHRVAFEVDGDPKAWFWHLIETLDLEQYSDRFYDELARQRIDEAINTVIWRRYSPDGRGGLFPLNNASQDQREVEIWYQLSAYLLELEPL